MAAVVALGGVAVDVVVAEADVVVAEAEEVVDFSSPTCRISRG